MATTDRQVEQQLAAVNAQIQTNSVNIAQALAKENQAAQAAAAQSAADAQAAQAAQAAMQQQLTALQGQYAQQSSAAQLQQAQQNINNQNALQLMQSTLAGYGIDPTGAISNAILGLTQSNYDAQTITALAQDPNASKSTDPNVVALANAWQTRFSGNTLREKAGLTPLDPASYIATENSYKAVMQQAGLPAAATDNALLGQLIGKDVSPAETQMRVNAAMAALQSEDPQVIAQLQSQYGLTQGALALHLLSPDIAANVIQQQVTAAQIGAEAARQGTNIQYGGTSPLSAMGLAAQGVTQAQAAQGFGTIAQQLPATQTLAARYNPYVAPEQVGQTLEASTFGTQGAAEAAAALKRLQTQEVSTFSGSSGASTQAQSLGIANAQGVS